MFWRVFSPCGVSTFYSSKGSKYSLHRCLDLYQQAKQHVPTDCSCITCNLARGRYLAVSQFAATTAAAAALRLAIRSGFFLFFFFFLAADGAALSPRNQKSPTQITRADVGEGEGRRNLMGKRSRRQPDRIWQRIPDASVSVCESTRMETQ